MPKAIRLTDVELTIVGKFCLAHPTEGGKWSIVQNYERNGLVAWRGPRNNVLIHLLVADVGICCVRSLSNIVRRPLGL